MVTVVLVVVLVELVVQVEKSLATDLFYALSFV
jgi:hypothetical protein